MNKGVDGMKEGVRDVDPEKAGMKLLRCKAQSDIDLLRKKRGMKLDDHPLQ